MAEVTFRTRRLLRGAGGWVLAPGAGAVSNTMSDSTKRHEDVNRNQCGCTSDAVEVSHSQGVGGGGLVCRARGHAVAGVIVVSVRELQWSNAEWKLGWLHTQRPKPEITERKECSSRGGEIIFWNRNVIKRCSMC